ncbi:MAG: hypothetical protein EA425_15945 [Puniceicoccaceae bacterium]|nr:MAG: hypothetical protein EA425_15945 [Puniceicoccaceae bacterium]
MQDQETTEDYSRLISPSLIVTGYVLLVLMPPVGMAIGLVLWVCRRPVHGAVMMLTPIMVLLLLAVRAGL